MKRLSLFAVALVMSSVFALALAAPAFALEGSPTGGTGRDILPPVVWMLGGAAASAVLLSLFYLLKRRLGGFPADPAWVAPITIMLSSESPQDGAGNGHASTDDHSAH